MTQNPVLGDIGEGEEWEIEPLETPAEKPVEQPVPQREPVPA